MHKSQMSSERTALLGVDWPSSHPGWRLRKHIGRDQFEEAVIAIDVFPRCAMLLTIFEGLSIGVASFMLRDGSNAYTRPRHNGSA